MQARLSHKHFFVMGLIAICLFYLCFEFFFNAYSMFSVDDFWFAHAAYKYKSKIPYRDFAPYKTVLGYYILLIPLLFKNSALTALIFVKDFLAIINVFVLFFTSLWISRSFSYKSILLSILILVTAELNLSYSTTIRADLLAYWLCFFSLILLLEKRFFIAGILLGIGFFTSQKAIWYIFASCLTLFICYFIPQYRYTLKQIVMFAAGLLLVVVSYFLFWSCFADLNIIVNSVFYEAALMYQLDWYASARQLFWADITLFNPLLFLLWPLTIISLFVDDPQNKNGSRFFITIYASSIIFCLMPYKQVFPYYMQVTFPVFFILYASFFSWWFSLLQHQQFKIFFIGKSGLWILIFAYITLIIYLQKIFLWPTAYLLFCMFPFLFACYCTQTKVIISAKLFLQCMVITFLFIGFIYPILLYSMRLERINGAYQKANIVAVNALLQEGGDYVAGVDLLYDKTQGVAGLRHLMYPAISYLYSPSAKLRAVMLPSLDEDANVSSQSIINTFNNTDIKFYVNNYRMRELPKNIQDFLHSQYQHYWGSIYIYAPYVQAGIQKVHVKFSGQYQIYSTTPIKLGTKKYFANSFVKLQKGDYNSLSKKSYRLKYIPQHDLKLNPKFQNDAWPLLVF